MTTTPETPTKPTPDEDFLEEARKRFKRAEEAERLIRERGEDDLKMVAGDQWDPVVKAERIADGRPCLTDNRLPQFVRQVCNDQRQNRPAIQVSPVDDNADVETAEVLQGLIRHIEYDSGADAAYDCAFKNAATTGIGYFRVITEFADPMSFDLDIKIKRIRNTGSVFIDPDAKEADRSDMRWAFIVEDFERSEFEARYPKTDLAAGGTTWEAAQVVAPDWIADKVRVAEYFTVTTRKTQIHMLDGGHVVEEDSIAKLSREEREKLRIVQTRDTEVPSIRWTKLCGTEILEDTTWPGLWIPIVPVLGDELEVDGKVILEGVIRHAKDTQKMLNVWVSAETETIGLAPRAPFIGAEGQFEGHPEWKTANKKNHAYLTYKPVTLGGSLAPPPQRSYGEANTSAITAARMQCQDDLKALTGIYDSALGAHSNETSGTAIRARQSQANTANFHLVDNLTRAIRHLGRILVDLIPKVYDTARVVRVIGEDGEERKALLNQEHTDPKTGKLALYDLSVGKYDVRVTAGPSYATKRQEAAASMMDLTRSYPPLAQFAGDLLVKNMDWPGAQEIADRLKKMLPPELQEKDPHQQQGDPQAQAKLEQMGQMVDALTAKLQESQAALNSKEMELNSKERIAELNAQVELTKTLAVLDQKDGQAMLQARLDQIQTFMNALGQLPTLPSQSQGPGPQAVPLQAGLAPAPEELEPATSGDSLGYSDAGLMPAPNAYGLPGASDQGPSMEQLP